MSRNRDDTTMGGGTPKFQTTRWTEIGRAQTQHPERRQASINNLIERYWKPVYCWLRRKDYSNDDAKDITQGFFCEVVLGRELIQQADRAKGRFRTFLLTALERYATSVYRKDHAKKRWPTAGLISLEAENLPDIPAEGAGASAEYAFTYAWVTSILDQALAEVEDYYRRNGKSTHWEIFRHQVLLPIYEDAKPLKWSEICKKYGIADTKQASNILINVKRHFRRVLTRLLGQNPESYF